MPKASKTRTIIVKVQTGGSKNVKALTNQIKKMGNSVEKASRSAERAGRSFKTGFLTILGGIGIREVARMADEMQLVENRLKVFTGSSEAAAATLIELQEAAKFTKSSIAGLGTIYNRLALSSKELGLSQEAILASTVALQQTFRLSGSTLAEATGASIQLSQGLAQGELRGQELRSVLEANIILADAFANELGRNRGELIKLAEQGKITSDVVFRTLGKLLPTLNKDAESLAVTFEQAGVIGLDAFRLKLNALNKELGLSSKFARGVTFLVDNLETLTITITTFVASKYLLTLATQADVATVAFGGLGKVLAVITSPISLVATALTATVLMLKDLPKYIESLKPKSIVEARKELESLLKIQEKLLEETKKKSETGGLLGRLLNSSDKIEELSNRVAKTRKELAKIREAEAKGLKFQKGENLATFLERLAKGTKELTTAKTKRTKEGLELLNEQFIQGKVALREYNLEVKSIELQKLNDNFDRGKISLKQYQDGLIKIGEELDRISGRSLFVVKIERNLQNLSKNLSDVAGGINSAINGAFDNMEDRLTSFVMGGKFEFSKFRDAVLEDITRIIIRAKLLAPLANVLTGAAGAGVTTNIGAGGGGGMVPIAQAGGINANGNAFHGGNVLPFARGGVVNGPTLFPMSNGTGLMGEAGPEAIMPLQRDGKGRLGVSGGNTTIVNVVNNSSNTDTETKESTGPNGERQIEVMVVDRVLKAVGEGKFDRTFRESYGINRRGR